LLHEVARTYGVTPFVAMLGAFQAFLFRLTGQDDLIVGSPSSTRTRMEAEKLIGFFVNTLVLRGDLSGRPTYADVLSRTRACAMDAFANSDLPFDSLVRELGVRRDPSRNPIFQVMFALFPSVRDLNMGALGVENVEVDTGGAQIDLTLYVSDAATSLRGIFEYNTDLFDRGTVEGFGESFETLLSGMLKDPDAEVESHPIVSGRRRTRLLTGAGPAPSAYPHERCVHNLFEDRRRDTPDAVALEASDATWTYRELDQRANQIARHLRSLGVQAGDYVGVCSSRRGHLVAALLGVMKSGAAYLPLDPSFPRERLAFMLAETAAPVVLAEHELRETLPASGAVVVELDTEWDRIAEASTRKPPERASGEDLAYVIFTSGSTGTPKGVQVPHRAVVNFLGSMADRPGLARGDTLLALTTISFDISVLELFLPLAVGAKLVLVDKDISGDGRTLATKIATSGTTVVQATPATWRLLFEAGWLGDSSLRVLCGGEALPKDLARQLDGAVGELWNMYGPTETTIWSTIAQVDDPGDIHIGRPIANTTCYVLDGSLCLVPVGTPGVLWIGGEGVTRGYVNRADLTSERFVPNPFGPDGAVMYNTGDLVRWRGDGNLQYLSRVDTQVKVRGFRIELAEIESVLARVPGVRAAVVTAHDFGAGDVRLVGYIVPAGEPLEASALRNALRIDLPEYMIPSMWETIESLPLTANAKVDRKALPVPGSAAPVTSGPSGVSMTASERELAEIWGKLLRLETVGVHDNFFDLGGHSLLVMQMIARVSESLGHRFNPLEVSLQTLGQLAAAIPVNIADTPALLVVDSVTSQQEEKPAVDASGGRGAGPEGAPAAGEHRRLLKKAARRLALRFIR
jgi:amino acid adenylation domain-containing protein